MTIRSAYPSKVLVTEFGVTAWTTAAPSKMIQSMVDGNSSTIGSFRHFNSTDFFSRRIVSLSVRDGGNMQVSCGKKSSKSHSPCCTAMWSCPNNARSFLADWRLCAIFDAVRLFFHMENWQSVMLDWLIGGSFPILQHIRNELVILSLARWFQRSQVCDGNCGGAISWA